MQIENLLLFLAASAAIAIVPGSGMLYTLGRGVGQGRKAALFSVAGLNTGALVHTALAALGVSVLIQQSAGLFYVVKYAGAAYLVYLGIKIVLDRESFGSSEGEGGREEALALLAAVGEGEAKLLAPSTVQPELFNALWQQHRREKLSREEIREH